MTMMKYKVCQGAQCESFTEAAKDIEKKLGLANVKIDSVSFELSYDNPNNCQVDEKRLEEAASAPGRAIQFEICG